MSSFLSEARGELDGCDNDNIMPPRGVSTPSNFESFWQFTYFITKLRIRRCRNSTCQSSKDKLKEDVAPHCQFSDLRLWALVVVSCDTTCQSSSPAIGEARKACEAFCHHFVFGSNETPRTAFWKIPEVNLKIWQIICWMGGGEMSLFASFLPAGIKLLNISTICNTIDELLSLKICPRHLWNLLIR
jgi:hypothetical protein